jgi:succinate dehydrogenase / fumarate reductase cytochrome b subunit
MTLLTSNVGRKILMAVSGLFMVMFLVAHLAGNTTIWGGPDWINAYAEHLHKLPLALWPLRIVMITVLFVHIFYGITLTLENFKATPGKYAVTKRQVTTFSGRTMIWTGLILLSFMVFHLLHFTFHVIPGVLVVADGSGRFDAYSMIVAGFMDRMVSAIYVLAMVVLFLHVSHGAQSIFQTFGLSSDRTLTRFGVLARVLSVIFLLGFGAIPVFVVANMLH